MDFWTLLLISFLGTFLASALVLFLFSPSFKERAKRFWIKAFRLKYPYLSKRKLKEIDTIQSMALMLALIAPLPYNPGEFTIQKIKTFLADVRNEAGKLRSKDMREIKTKLIAFSNNESRIEDNMELEEARDVLGSDNIHNLSQDIWQTIENIKEGK